MNKRKKEIQSSCTNSSTNTPTKKSTPQAEQTTTIRSNPPTSNKNQHKHTRTENTFTIRNTKTYTYKRHPYGILPSGNIFINPNATSQRYNGLGASLYTLSDELLLSLLSYCDIATFLRLMQCSTSMYIVCHNEDLWRDACLLQNDHQSTSIPWGKGCTSWKDVVIGRKHNPLDKISYYSDVLFRPWYCMNYNIESILPSKETIPKLQYQDAKECFIHAYQARNTPCVITGIPIPNVTVDYLLKGVRDSSRTTFRATSGAASHPANFTLREYINYCRNGSMLDEVPLYLFDRDIRSKAPMMVEEILGCIYKACPYWDSSQTPSHDLFRLLDDDDAEGDDGNDSSTDTSKEISICNSRSRRPDYQWIIIGPKRSGSIFHIDPNSTNAWNATLSGYKYWILYPPNHTPPGIHPSADLDTVTLPISISEWIYLFWNDHLLNRRNGITYECITKPGDVIFVPHNWWHCVINYGEDVNIAMTMNYACQENLKHVLWFTKQRKDQISGCRDRNDTAVQPEQLYDDLRTRLMKKGYDPLNLEVDEDFECGSCHMALKSQRDEEGMDTASTPALINTRKKGDDRIDTTLTLEKEEEDPSKKEFAFSFF